MSDQLNSFLDVASTLTGLPDDGELMAAIRGYDAVLQHTDDGVEVLRARDYKELPTDLLELRAFDDAGELHIVKVGDALRGRVRKDGEGEPCAVFDEEHLVWGSRAVLDGDVVELCEDRGNRVRIPSALLGGRLPDEQHRVTVRVRNYLDENGEDAESGDTRFAFCDYRLVGLCVREVE